MITFPKAKINIGLQILGKRDDGFHEIQTLMYPIGWSDSLEILESDESHFYFHGKQLPSGGPNTVQLIHQKMQERYGVPNIELHLTKGIPMGAGLGGGSADAAYTATMLNSIFDLNLSTQVLEGICAEVGSDCPFFVKNEPQFCQGRGEILSPSNLDLSGLWLVAVNPGIHIATGPAYSNAQHSGPFDPSRISVENISEWDNLISNDFQVYTFDEIPQIREMNTTLRNHGALYSALSGSGSTVFGLFSEKPSIKWESGLEIWEEQL